MPYSDKTLFANGSKTDTYKQGLGIRFLTQYVRSRHLVTFDLQNVVESYLLSRKHTLRGNDLAASSYDMCGEFRGQRSNCISKRKDSPYTAE